MFQGTKSRSIFYLFSCAMLEAALKRTKTLLGRSQDLSRRPRTPIGFGFGGNLGVTWSILGPKTAPRRNQDATKTYPRPAQNTSQDALGSQNRPDTQNRSKMNSRTPQNRAPNPVGKLQNRAKTLLENFENPAQTLLENFRNRAPNPPKSNANGASNF